MRRELTCAKIDPNTIVDNKASVQLMYCGESEKEDKWVLKVTFIISFARFSWDNKRVFGSPAWFF